MSDSEEVAVRFPENEFLFEDLHVGVDLFHDCGGCELNDKL